jgi:hypothetical protein
MSLHSHENNFVPWTPQVGDEVRVLVDRSEMGNFIYTDRKHRVVTIRREFAYVEPVNNRNQNLGVKLDQLEPWTE